MKHKSFLVSYETYINYINENNNDKLHRFASIYTSKYKPPENILLNEIFEEPKPFKIEEPKTYICKNIPNEYNYTYYFSTKKRIRKKRK
jgi:hypothetical protein